jgi:hypothetical protein
MNPRYTQVADDIYQEVNRIIERFREQLAREGVAVHKIPQAAMQVELVAHVLIQVLAEERITMTDNDDVEEALKQALQRVRDTVIHYRREGREVKPKPADKITQH